MWCFGNVSPFIFVMLGVSFDLSCFFVVLGPQIRNTKYTFDSKVALKLVCLVK